MPDQELLFSLLQFVALVIPAVAIIIQVLQGSNDESNSGIIRVLELSLLLLFFGGLIIIGQLLYLIEGESVQIGTGLIFSSLIFVSLALIWKSLPLNIEPSIDSIEDLLSLSKSALEILISFVLPIGAVVFVYFFSNSWVVPILDIGPIHESNIITPSLIFAVILFPIPIRIIFYLINVGYVSNYTGIDTFSESLGATVLFVLIYPLFVLPVYGAAQLIYIVLNYLIAIESTNIIFIFPHLWATFMIFVMFGTNFWGEKEDEERLMADDDD